MHTIRLRAPWEQAPLADRPGVVRCTRHFNKPTGLDGGEQVWLVIDSVAAAVTINGAPVGQASRLPAQETPVRIDITPHLQPRNKLEIDVASPPAGDAIACLGEVRLEIE